jgi:integrase
MIRAGLRQGELLELRWSDVDRSKGVVRVRRAIDDEVTR